MEVCQRDVSTVGGVSVLVFKLDFLWCNLARSGLVAQTTGG